MSNYNAKKKPELEALLKERGLPHTGNKADLVARLQEDDAQKQGGTGAETEKIDWDDEGAAAAPPAGADTNQAAAADATTSEAGAAALAAGGQGAVANPVAVPNQIQAEDPAVDDSLTVKEPGTEGEPIDVAATEGGDNAAAAGEQAKPKLTAEELAAKKAAEEAKFAAGLAASSVDAEAEKRRRRAERFGIQVSEEDAKKDERAKRFGAEANLNEQAVSALDSALPEREQRKRGRERADVGTGGRGDKRVDSRRRQGGGRRERGGAGGSDRGFNNQDRAAMQKRLDRFGGGAKASAT